MKLIDVVAPAGVTAIVDGLVGVAGRYQALFWKRVHGWCMQPGE